jgi:hypothetical protein
MSVATARNGQAVEVAFTEAARDQRLDRLLDVLGVAEAGRRGDAAAVDAELQVVAAGAARKLATHRQRFSVALAGDRVGPRD